MIILVELNMIDFDIISYEFFDDIPIKYKYDDGYLSCGCVLDSDNQDNKYYINIDIFLSYLITHPMEGVINKLTNNLLKILRKEKLKTIG